MNTSGIAKANGTAVYYERRGSGPAVLFIPGATGDAGHLKQAAESLADEFTIITYDRRGNSRSPAPKGWMETSIEEQAADAAGLLGALGLGPVGVFGTSGGAPIGLELALHHFDRVLGAVLHEPYLPAALGDRWEEIDAQNKATFGPILAAGGPRALMEAWLHFMRGNAGYATLDSDLRERMLANGEAFLIERAAYPRYQPDTSLLASIRRPVVVLIGEEGAPWAAPMAGWLARQLGTEVLKVPGGHGAYLDDARVFAESLRPYLRQITSAHGTTRPLTTRQ